MIRSFGYKKNKIRKIELKDISKFKSWVRLVDPTKQEIEEIAKFTNIPLSELLESYQEEERPRLTKENYIEIIYSAPYIEKGEGTTVPLNIYLYKNNLITLEKRSNKILDLIENEMEKNRYKFLFKKGVSYFIFFILDKINDDFLTKIDKIARNIDVYEEVTKRDLTIKDIEKIYEQSVTLSFFNQALIANIEVLNALRKGHFKQFKGSDRTLFEELYYDALQVLDTEKIQREAITNLFQLQSIISSSKLNEFMKKLTTIALIIAIPTLISGMYGMNFLHIPLRNHPYGFIITSSIILIITFSFYLLFKRFDWV